jgi:primosomal protein N' (replication factor Y)
LAPFGKRELTGIVVNLKSSGKGIICKDIIDLLDEKPLISEQMLRLTGWISDYYMADWGQALQLALPKGLEKKSNVVIEPVNAADIDAGDLSDNQKFLLDLIIWEPGKTSSYYKKKYGTGSFDYTVRQLKNKNLINLQKQIRPERIRKKNKKYITLSTGLIDKMSVIKKSGDLLPLLLPLEGNTISYNDFRSHTQLTPGRIKTMQKHGILEMNEREVFRRNDHLYREEIKDVVLNQDQQHVLGEISRAIQNAAFRVFLLHGVTGSGKTQVYLEAIQNVIAREKSAIILIPEISLTPQTVGRFESFFPGMISVFHSKMSLGEPGGILIAGK